MFRLPDSWVWDFWLAEDGDTYHLFFLYASRALHDPDRRHLRAGHRARHLHRPGRTGNRSPTHSCTATPASFDQTATWTGSVIKGPGGDWFMFYTGTTRTPDTGHWSNRSGWPPPPT